MTIRQLARSRQQERAGQLAQGGQGKPHVNPYGTPGMSLNQAGNYRKIVPVDKTVARQVKRIAFDHMKNGYGVSNGEDISGLIQGYVLSLAPEERLSASWTLNEMFHTEATRLAGFVRQHNPGWDWGAPFDTSILEDYRQGVDITA
ncbi:hypothetical protein [Acutalibacter intestini]|uniref:hypothetical protein n=1 Tax=Acutalibacter intestini TaxID=3093659 RepID=UPI002AC8A758|nr:hypothetical protein [Acutalibacter sp. M00204]